MVMSCDVPKKQEAAILVHGFQYVTASWVWLLECSIQTEQYQEFNDWWKRYLLHWNLLT